MVSAPQPEQEQPFVDTAAVIASGLASVTVTLLTPLLGLDVAGALVAAAVMSMFTTAISAFYQGHIVEALNKFAPRLVEAWNKFASRPVVWVLLVGAIICLIVIGAVSGVEVVVWILLVGTIICLIVIGKVTGVKAVAWVVLVGVITCIIGIGVVTGVEKGVGKTLPCWLGEKININLGDNCSGDTQPSILGGNPIYWDDTADSDGIGAGDPVEYVPGTQPLGWVTQGGDNCPDVYNPGQIDSDGNGTGDDCSIPLTAPFYFDADGDGIGEGDPVEYVPGTQPPGWVTEGGDNCPDVANSGQLYPYDTDGDGVGDACSNLIID